MGMVRHWLYIRRIVLLFFRGLEELWVQAEASARGKLAKEFEAAAAHGAGTQQHFALRHPE